MRDDVTTVTGVVPRITVNVAEPNAVTVAGNAIEGNGSIVIVSAFTTFMVPVIVPPTRTFSPMAML